MDTELVKIDDPYGAARGRGPPSPPVLPHSQAKEAKDPPEGQYAGTVDSLLAASLASMANMSLTFPAASKSSETKN